MEEAVAEELLDGRRVEVAKEVEGPVAGAADEREDGIVGRGVLEPAEPLGEVGGSEADAAAVEAGGGLRQLLVGRRRVDGEERLLHGALVVDDDEAGHPLPDPDELDPADPGGARLGRGGDPGRVRHRGKSRRGEAEPLVGGELDLPELVADHQLLHGRERPLGDERLDVEAVARIRGDAPRRRVGVPEEAGHLELGEDVADRRRADAQRVPLHERVRPDRRSGGDVFLDDGQQDRLGSGVERTAAAADSSRHGMAPLGGPCEAGRPRGVSTPNM